MNCIFCGKETSNSKSVEHIIPQSLGNNTAILPKGIVCDACNNYFARKVEGPLLNSDEYRMLRQELKIPNKSGKLINNYTNRMLENFEIKQITEGVYCICTPIETSRDDIPEVFDEYNKYVEDTDNNLITPNKHMSWLLSKMAVEYFVYRCGCSHDVCEYITNDEVFKPIRQYARFGNREIWPYSARRIYSRNTIYKGDFFSYVSWESDIFFMGRGEVYFVIAIHGIEYAINFGGPVIDGYLVWLKEHNGISPLYADKSLLEKEREDYIKKQTE